MCARGRFPPHARGLALSIMISAGRGAGPGRSTRALRWGSVWPESQRQGRAWVIVRPIAPDLYDADAAARARRDAGHGDGRDRRQVQRRRSAAQPDQDQGRARFAMGMSRPSITMPPPGWERDAPIR